EVFEFERRLGMFGRLVCALVRHSHAAASPRRGGLLRPAAVSRLAQTLAEVATACNQIGKVLSCQRDGRLRRQMRSKAGRRRSGFADMNRIAAKNRQRIMTFMGVL